MSNFSCEIYGKSVSAFNGKDKNLDAYFVDQSNGVMAVCDGMSSHPDSRFASAAVIKYFSSYRILRQLRKAASRTAMKDVLRKVFCDAQLKIEEEAIRRKIHDLIGTTGVLAKLWQPANEAQLLVSVAHIGDSRCYFKHAENFECKTIDANEVMDDLRTTLPDAPGKLMQWQNGLDNLRNPEEYFAYLKSIGLSEEKIKEYSENYGEMLIALMTSNKEFDLCTPTVSHMAVTKEDEIYLMSDGISKNVSPAKLREIALLKISIKEKADQMIEEAQKIERIGEVQTRCSPDDTTVTVMSTFLQR